MWENLLTEPKRDNMIIQVPTVDEGWEDVAAFLATSLTQSLQMVKQKST